MIEELMFKSSTTGRFQWVMIDHEQKVYSTAYYLNHSMSIKPTRVSKKQLKETIERIEKAGYTEL